MRTIATTFLLLAVAALSVPAQDIDQALRNMVERKIAEMDDPLTMDTVEVDGFEAFGLVSLDGDMTNLRIRGIHNIVLQNIQLNTVTLEMPVDVIVPELIIDATQYDLAGRFGGLIPIFGKGSLAVTVKGVRVQGVATLAVSSDLYVSLASFKSTLSLNSLVCNFQNLLLGGEFGDLMNYVIGDMIPFVVRNQQAEVTAAVEQMVLERANESLEGMLLEDLLDHIMSFA